MFNAEEPLTIQNFHCLHFFLKLNQNTTCDFGNCFTKIGQPILKLQNLILTWLNWTDKSGI